MVKRIIREGEKRGNQETQDCQRIIISILNPGNSDQTVDFLQNLACTVQNDFDTKLVVTQNIFLSCSRHFDQELIVVIVFYFQI